MDRKNYIILTVVATLVLIVVAMFHGRAVSLMNQGNYMNDIHLWDYGYDLKQKCLTGFYLDYLAMLVGTAYRCKYRGKSGWNCLWLLVPVISFIYPIYNCIKK